MPGEDLSSWMIGSWTQRLGQGLEAMTGERPRMAWRPAPQAPPEELLWWEQGFHGLSAACLFAGAPKETWRRIGLHVMRAAGIEEADPAEARGTYLEILAQACAGLARDLGTRLGSDVSCEGGKEAPGVPPGLQFFIVEIALADGAPLELWAGCSPPHGRPESEITALATTPSPPVSVPTRNPTTLELLMEVELPVSISFGRAQMPLKDVLKLTTGSIVELNRSISEPVEVIVNNCVVARGEVVVVDGNYGVRIHQIVSRSERLRTLK